MIDTLIFLADNHNQATVVNELEETLLRVFIVVIMFGLGAGLTPKDFGLALRRPWGLIIGWVTQFAIMPFVAYILIVTVLFRSPNQERWSGWLWVRSSWEAFRREQLPTSLPISRRVIWHSA